jgi:hypothetical protein
MSTSVSTRSPGTLSPTRQQLDELDALLKRMLDLPVNQLEDGEETEDAEEPPAPPPVQRVQPPRSARVARSVQVAAGPETRVERLQSETRAERLARVSDPADEGRARAMPASRPVETKPQTQPVSYMVVETASPRPLPAASGFEPQPTGLGMRLMPVNPVEESSVEETPAAEPISGGVGDPRRALVPAAEPVVGQGEEVESASTEGETWVPLLSTWKPSAQTWQPLAESWQQARGEPSAPVVMPEPIANPFVNLAPSQPEVFLTPQPAAAIPDVIVQRIPVLPASRPSQVETEATAEPVAPSEPRLTLSAEDAPVMVPGLLLPVVWFNQGFDACMAPLGAPGRWLSGPAGRQTLGALGVLGLVAAGVLLVSAGMGWTW